ncbi:MAG TPA: GGDEF domain-containing protein [Chromatiaceae bacterium]|nr:MAG: GGDEF domain-containing protein [Thiohalocapsa sp. PB-PSB1]HBG95720.1 GGDEF domain-containing protein [Chromatiaceae bacterium]HCS90798.1 GGDEF domain-containing protein [Chromatiaceae bacterium]
MAGAGLSGLVWGASGVLLMHPQSYPYQVLIAFALGGMIAGAVPILSCLPQAYIAFAVPTMLPVTLNMLLAGDRIHLNMGLLLLVFSLAMVLSSMRMSQTLLELCDLRLHRDLSNKERKTLERLLRIDEMTGIANRRCFDETIKLEWRRGQREGGNMALISADIDNFKEYNDLYGHPAGDSCLAQVAKAMQDALNRPGDLAARTGGEEFSFVLPNTSLQGAGYIAERLRNSVQALNIPHAGQPDTGKVTISVGVAACDHHKVDTLDSLVQLADEALYQAKRQGRNGVVLAT